MKIAETPRRLRLTVAAIAASAMLGVAGLAGVAAPSAAAATGHGKHGAHATIGPLPRALRSLPGVRHVLWTARTHAPIPWWVEAAPCPGPHGRTLRPKSVERTGVLGGMMRGWCPLHAGDVLLYVPTTRAIGTTSAATLALPAGTVVTAAFEGGWPGISTGARSFKVTAAVAKAVAAADAVETAWLATAWVMPFRADEPVGQLGPRLVRTYVDAASPYREEVAQGRASLCALATRQLADAHGVTGASAADAAVLLLVGPHAPESLPCAARHGFAAAQPLEYADVQVAPLRSYAPDGQTGVRAGFFVEANRSLTRVYRVWVPWGAELSFGEPWQPAATRWAHFVGTGWAELRPARPTAHDPSPWQIWQPQAGTLAWPSGYVAGGPAAGGTMPGTLCPSPSRSPSVVTGWWHQAPVPSHLSCSV